MLFENLLPRAPVNNPAFHRLLFFRRFFLYLYPYITLYIVNDSKYILEKILLHKTMKYTILYRFTKKGRWTAWENLEHREFL